jgi:hypothetical protein
MTMLTTPDQIHRYGLAVLRHRLKLELKMPIWRVKSTLDSARRVGFKGRTRKEALAFVLQLEAVAWEGIPQLHLVEEVA